MIKEEDRDGEGGKSWSRLMVIGERGKRRLSPFGSS